MGATDHEPESGPGRDDLFRFRHWDFCGRGRSLVSTSENRAHKQNRHRTVDSRKGKMAPQRGFENGRGVCLSLRLGMEREFERGHRLWKCGRHLLPGRRRFQPVRIDSRAEIAEKFEEGKVRQVRLKKKIAVSQNNILEKFIEF